MNLRFNFLLIKNRETCFKASSFLLQVLGLLIEVLKDGFQKYIDSLLPVMRNILQSAVNVIANKQVDLPNDATISSWKEAYYSLVLFEKILNQFPKLCFRKDLEVFIPFFGLLVDIKVTILLGTLITSANMTKTTFEHL